MNQQLQELVDLYEAMHTCWGSEKDRTEATQRLEAAISRVANSKNLESDLLMRHVKTLYFQRARSEDRRTGGGSGKTLSE